MSLGRSPEVALSRQGHALRKGSLVHFDGQMPCWLNSIVVVEVHSPLRTAKLAPKEEKGDEPHGSEFVVMDFDSAIQDVREDVLTSRAQAAQRRSLICHASWPIFQERRFETFSVARRGRCKIFEAANRGSAR